MTVPTMPGGPLIPDLRYCTSALFNGVEMLKTCWILDVLPMLDSPDVRGDNEPVPGEAGSVPFPHRAASTTLALELTVNGFIKADGTTFTSPWVGIETNWFYLRAHVLDPIDSGDGTYSCDLTMPSGAHLIGDVTPKGGKVKARVGPIWTASFSVEVPLGALPLP